MALHLANLAGGLAMALLIVWVASLMLGITGQ